MDRRGFFARIGAVAAGLSVAKYLPSIAPKPPALAFDPKAFEMVSAGLDTFKPGDTFTIESRYQVGNTIRVRLPQRYQRYAIKVSIT